MKAGDKVVCVDDSPGRGRNQWLGTPCPARRGIVYVVTDAWIAITGYPVVSVAGIDMGCTITGLTIGLLASRFRPVAEVGHPPIAVERPQPCATP